MWCVLCKKYQKNKFYFENKTFLQKRVFIGMSDKVLSIMHERIYFDVVNSTPEASQSKGFVEFETPYFKLTIVPRHYQFAHSLRRRETPSYSIWENTRIKVRKPRELVGFSWFVFPVVVSRTFVHRFVVKLIHHVAKPKSCYIILPVIELVSRVRARSFNSGLLKYYVRIYYRGRVGRAYRGRVHRRGGNRWHCEWCTAGGHYCVHGRTPTHHLLYHRFFISV